MVRCRIDDDQGREGQGRGPDHGRRRLAGLEVVARGAEPLADGTAWGYGGSGPAQLAPGVLLSVTDAATAERFYQRFKWSVIAPIEADRWTLDAGDILGWLESAAGTDDFMRLAVAER